MKTEIVNRSGFEVDFYKDCKETSFPFTCPVCKHGTSVIVEARLLSHEIEACPDCYNTIVTDMELIIGFKWESWFPLDQYNHGEWPFRFLRYWLKKKWLNLKRGFIQRMARVKKGKKIKIKIARTIEELYEMENEWR